MSHTSRRAFMKAGAASAGISMLGSLLLTQLSAQSFGVSPARLTPFPLSSVRLTSGVFKEQEEISAQYLDSLSTDQLLHSFRLTAGIASSVTPYEGWEAPDCELRGHFAGGHYLSAAALASAGAGNTVLKRRGDTLVDGLAACQKKIGTGYVGAYPTDLYDRLAAGRKVWAPFYTYHKIMAGLLDMYLLTGNTDALQVAEGMAKWTGDFLWPIGTEQRQRMLREEHGGMNEVLVNLAAITKKERYLETARLFEQPVLLNPLAERRDELEGLHANTNVPKIIGAARMYEVTGDRRHRDIAEYFLEEVVGARSYVIGNSSVDEFWKTPPMQLQGTLGWKNAECCVAYNTMKLERLVFSWTGNARWMDAYERALFNCRLGTQNAQGLKQYFVPLATGYYRAYNTPERSFWCCTGTGAEEFAKFADTIYFHRGRDLYVNQFIASRLEWKEEDLAVEQVTRFPLEQGTTLRFKSSRAVERTVHLRIPSWTTNAAKVKINGRPLEAIADPGSYLAIQRTWQDGDTLTVSLPMELTTESLAGTDDTKAVLYGPLALATSVGPGPVDTASRQIHNPAPEEIPAALPLPRAGGGDVKEWVRPESISELRFRAKDEHGEADMMPLYQVKDQRYSLYWRAGETKAT